MEFDMLGLEVSDGGSQGRTWGTYRRDRRTGKLERVYSRHKLDDRPTREEAEVDLRAFLEEMAYRGRKEGARRAGLAALAEHGWLRVETSNG